MGKINAYDEESYYSCVISLVVELYQSLFRPAVDVSCLIGPIYKLLL